MGIPRGGAQLISNALAAYFKQLGGEIVTSTRVESIADLPPFRCVLFDVTPHQLLRLAGERFPKSFNAKLRAYRYGPAAFKLDWALDGPVPWRAPECTRASTVERKVSETGTLRGPVWQRWLAGRCATLITTRHVTAYESRL